MIEREARRWRPSAAACLLLAFAVGCGGSGASGGSDGEASLDSGILFGDRDGGAIPPADLGGPPDPLDAGEPSPDGLADTPAPPVDLPPPPDVPGAPADRDQDGEPDATDNCPDVPNPTQADQDGDDEGDRCDDDRDGDFVPNDDDRWPDDPTLPGVIVADSVYAHTSDKLYRLDVKTFQVSLVGTFRWPSDGLSHQMTDLAIDRWGVLYGMSFDGLYLIVPDTGACHSLGALPSGHSFNGMTFVPGGVFGVAHDVLVAVSQNGDWFHIDVGTTPTTASLLGNYDGYGSSGDAFSVQDVGTFASATPDAGGNDVIVELDPRTGRVLREVVPLPGYYSVWGLAGWNQLAFAFDETGAILVVDVSAGTLLQEIRDYDHAWWGAGTKTVVTP